MRYTPLSFARGRTAAAYKGRMVTTTDGRTGVVDHAFVADDGVIKLYVVNSTEHTSFYTDHEHATIVRDKK